MSVRTTVGFVDSPERAAAVLHPLRLRILQTLSVPDSAAGLARRFQLPRQRVNYHLRELERAGLLRRAGKHRRGNMIEQRYIATAQSYVLSPELLGRLGTEPREAEDAFSATYLLGLSSQLQSELGRAVRDASAQGKRLATLSISSELRFESARQREKFAHELQQAVVDVVGRYASPSKRSDGAAGAGRLYRLVLGCYPVKEEKQ